MTLHPARTVPFDALFAGLQAAHEKRLVYRRPGPDGLVLYVYSEHCMYEGAWDEFTMAARGLILDVEERRIAATPFPKFFNAGERGAPIPDLPFSTTEKLDGSLIIIFHHRGRWRTATKGSFTSAQAIWAQERLAGMDLSRLAPGTTYLAEATYPENKVVVFYPETRLRMLSAYGPDGAEIPFEALAATGFETVARLDFNSVADMLATAKTLPRSQEGYVVRFEDGLRLKIKGDEYRRIHALISNLTPLAIWQAMASGDNMEAIRRDLPEEFWGDFDTLVSLLQERIDRTAAAVARAAAAVAHLPDKDVGLALPTLDEAARPYIFDYRKGGGNLLAGRAREKLFRAIRPTGNELPGYQPSSAMNRVAEELG